MKFSSFRQWIVSTTGSFSSVMDVTLQRDGGQQGLQALPMRISVVFFISILLRIASFAASLLNAARRSNFGPESHLNS